MAETGPRPAIFYHPDQPFSNHLLEELREFAGWDLADRPESADWCVLYQDATWVALAADDPFAEIATTWINGRCRDISKRTVERVFEETFGYPLAIDPLTYEGVCVRKSNRNYVKDAVVVSCPVPAAAVAGEGDPVISPWDRPVPAAAVDGQYVYERLVDSRVPDLGIVEIRATVVRGQVAVAKRKILRDWISTGRIPEVEDVLDATVVYPDSVFSRQEREHIAAFCDALGLDFGGLDIIRDNVDGRVYLLDANKTPSTITDHPTVSALMRATMLGLLAQAFVERYPRVKVRRRDNLLFARPLRYLRPRRVCG